MHDFMEYCLRQYFKATDWNDDNQYSNLCAASRAILDFQIPRGFTFAISKIQTSLFKSSYSLNASPILNGSLGFLFTSRPLIIDLSSHLKFTEIIDRFNVNYIPNINTNNEKEIQPIKDYLLYGRLHIPTTRLETIYSKRFSSRIQCVITSVNDLRIRSDSHLTAELQYDTGKWCNEFSYTTDGELFGIRGLYNFSGHNLEEKEVIEEVQEALSKKEKDTKKYYVEKKTIDKSPDLDEVDEVEVLKGVWSIGGEIYYGVREKSGGVSVGIRYRTLPQYSNQAPVTVTYIINPIMGHMSAAYVAQVSDVLTLCPRFDFNMYSYESDLMIGGEWWQRKKPDERNDETSKQLGDINGVVKATIGTSKGKYGNILFSLGLIADLSSRLSPIKSVGLQFQYFS
ncbi:304_t:CDS:2 [Entrophospora sp. SA101]|nr:12528_t:CDS:2 [Entrophospora sp. SA101]CAJ0831603.1 13152_t:CDS:2 [Entrophospora sp. SA101]CAJ0912143.1 304_t:CDS:2 [Entrophospora sp. SA101]